MTHTGVMVTEMRGNGDTHTGVIVTETRGNGDTPGVPAGAKKFA